MTGLAWRSRFAGLVAASEFAGRGLLLLAQVLTARLLGPEQFGLLAPALVLANFLWVVLELGHDRILVARTSAAPSNARDLLMAAIQLRLAAGALAIALLVVLAQLGAVPAFAIALGSWAVSESVIRAARLSQLGRLRAHVDAAVHISQRVLTLVLVIALAHDAASAAIAYGIANVLTLVGLIALRIVLIGRADHLSLHDVTRGSLPLFLSSLVALVAQLDVIWLAVSVDATQVGIYRAVSQLQVAAGLPAQVMASVALPVLVSEQRSSTAAVSLRRFLAPFLAGGVLAALGLAVGAETLLHVVFGEAFVAGARASVPLGLAALLVYMNWGLGTLSVVAGRGGTVFRATALGTLVNVLGNAALIPWIGFVGSGWARAASEGAATGTYVSVETRISRERRSRV